MESKYTHKHTRIAGGAAQRSSRSMKKRIFCSIKIQFKYFVCYFFAVVLCFVVMCSSVYYAIRFELLIVVRWVRNSMWCAQNITILKKKKIECEGTNRSVRVAGEKGKWRWMFLSFCAFFFFHHSTRIVRTTVYWMSEAKGGPYHQRTSILCFFFIRMGIGVSIRLISHPTR